MDNIGLLTKNAANNLDFRRTKNKKTPRAEVRGLKPVAGVNVNQAGKSHPVVRGSAYAPP